MREGNLRSGRGSLENLWTETSPEWGRSQLLSQEKGFGERGGTVRFPEAGVDRGRRGFPGGRCGYLVEHLWTIAHVHREPE